MNDYIYYGSYVWGLMHFVHFGIRLAHLVIN